HPAVPRRGLGRVPAHHRGDHEAQLRRCRGSGQLQGKIAMARIVAACATTHSPGLGGWIEQEEEPKRIKVLKGLEQLREKLFAAKPDLLILIATDHMLTSPPYNMPDFAIGVGEEHSGPAPGIDLW